MQEERLARRLRRGDRSALARAISMAENGDAAAGRLVRLLDAYPDRAFVVGVTGPPGTGKSTLAGRLIESYRRLGLRVGVVAVDPTSPITGGALLGDRVRLTAHSTDRDVFVRSMASRGWTGGLSRAVSYAVRLMDVAGMDVVLVETVGIGQSDVDVASISNAVVVVLMPGMGDDVQVSKAGLMEIGDVYVVNKSDLQGADSMVVALLSMAKGLRSRSPYVLKVSAAKGEGVETLVSALEKVRTRFAAGDQEVRLRRIRGTLVELARAQLTEGLSTSSGEVDALARQVLSGKLGLSAGANRLTAEAISGRAERKRDPTGPRRRRPA